MQDRGDMYGKLDALFEKRSTDGLVDHALAKDEFPELTDMIPASSEVRVEEIPDLDPVERRATDRRAGDRRRADRRRGDRRADGADDGQSPVADAEVDRLIRAMEARLGDLFSSHQSCVEEMVRQAIRIELDRQRQEQG